MLRSQLRPMPEYFDRYINLCDDVPLLDAIQTSLDELDRLPLDRWAALGDRVYAPGKWTLRDILQHLVDTERVFSYRALAFARGDQQAMPPFSEDDFAASAGANHRSLHSLVEEMKISRHSFLELYQSFTPEMLARTGMGFRGLYSVAAIGFIMPGHQRWHLKVLEERYYPLIERT
jgi:hypothetical protein